MTNGQFPVISSGCVCLNRVPTSHRLTVGSWLEQDAAGIGFLQLLKEISPLVDTGPVFTKTACRGQICHAQMLYWQCKHPKQAPPPSLTSGVHHFSMICLRKNPDVALDSCTNSGPGVSFTVLPTVTGHSWLGWRRLQTVWFQQP